MKAEEVKRLFSHLTLNAEAEEYLNYNAARYATLIEVVYAIRGSIPAETVSILDVGPSFFTSLLAQRFSSDRISALGLDSPESRGGHLPGGIPLDSVAFHRFNLNDAQDQEKWLPTPPFDIIIASEVVEHLYTAPTLIVRFLASLLIKGGYLIVTVPNAAALLKRLLLLLGKHPYEMIRENAANPGHYREYTRAELLWIGGQCGMITRRVDSYNYNIAMDKRASESLKGRILRFMTAVAPSSMHNNLAAVYQKPA